MLPLPEKKDKNDHSVGVASFYYFYFPYGVQIYAQNNWDIS